MTRIVDVGGHAPYRITIGDGLLHDGAALASRVRGRHVMIVSDAHVAPLYARGVADALQAANPDLRCMVTCIPAGETAKSLDRFADLLRELAEFRCDAQTPVFALGAAGRHLAGSPPSAGSWHRCVNCRHASRW